MTKIQQFLLVAILILLLISGISKAETATKNGTFFPNPNVEILPNDEPNMRLLRDFHYISQSGRIWKAPSGTVTNGASIPKWAWTFVGGPWSGKYRNAAIIHDHYYDVKLRPKDQVDAIFYEGMLISGVSSSKAWIMYKAVSLFAENWHIEMPNKCANIENLDMDKCVQNSGVQATTRPAKELTKNSASEFINIIRSKGYDDDADLLQLIFEKEMNP